MENNNHQAPTQSRTAIMCAAAYVSRETTTLPREKKGSEERNQQPYNAQLIQQQTANLVICGLKRHRGGKNSANEILHFGRKRRGQEPPNPGLTTLINYSLWCVVRSERARRKGEARRRLDATKAGISLTVRDGGK